MLGEGIPMRTSFGVHAFSVFAVVASLLCPAGARAVLLQILHTNDLHSHFDEAEDRSLAGLEPAHKPMGGYAQVKALIDKLKAEASARGIESLVLDAGDFSEGTQYFLPGQGEESWKLMNAMGYDAVALGNHEYLMGENDLDRIVGHVQPTFPLLAANFLHSTQLKNLNQSMSPYVEVQRAGAKIAILGLTTDDFVYKWRAGHGVIIPPRQALKRYIAELNRRDDYVILLTHLGVDADKALLEKGAGVDLVVGGHSHTFLYPYAVQKDHEGHAVPIVQAGQHGQVVGRLLVDVEPGQPLRIQSYELVNVEKDGPKDPVVDQAIQNARQELSDEFGDAWLHEPIGYSDIPLLVPRDAPTVWGSLVADAMKNSVGADLSLDAGGQLFGDNLPAGPVTREKLFRFYPRVFGFQEKEGWDIWTISVRGWVLRTLIEISMDQGLTFNASGATYQPVKEAGLWHLRNFRIAGHKLEDLKTYHVALPEGIGRAIKEISPIFQAWMHHPRDSGIPIWSSIEDEFRRRGGVVKAD